MSDKDPRQVLAEWKALAEWAGAAMPGVWAANGLDAAGMYAVMSDDPDLAGEYVAHGALEEVAAFIAAARTAVPALVKAVEAVLALHPAEPCHHIDGACKYDCDECDEVWPCPTVRAITEALTEEDR